MAGNRSLGRVLRKEEIGIACCGPGQMLRPNPLISMLPGTGFNENNHGKRQTDELYGFEDGERHQHRVDAAVGGFIAENF
jgi:hypothetical protein